MKTYKSSDLTNNKRSEVFREAEANGVIIQQCRTNGDVIGELVLMSKKDFDGAVKVLSDVMCEGDL